MMKIEKMRKITGRAVMAAVLAVVLCLQPCMSVAAGHFITDPATMLTRYVEDDGTFGEFQWVQIPSGYMNQGRWVYIGPQGYIITEDCAVPGPVIDMGNGVFAVDQRGRRDSSHCSVCRAHSGTCSMREPDRCWMPLRSIRMHRPAQRSWMPCWIRSLHRSSRRIWIHMIS